MYYFHVSAEKTQDALSCSHLLCDSEMETFDWEPLVH
jgi:hypothetical protein